MEHIVQFGISVDDEIIKQQIMESAEKKVLESITNDIKNAIFRTNYYGQPTNQLNSFVEEKLESIIEPYKDEIIKLAAEKLADRLGRSKKVKELLNNITAD